MKFERAFISVLENTLGPSAVTSYNRNTSTNYHLYLHRCPNGRMVQGASQCVPRDGGDTWVRAPDGLLDPFS